MPKLVVQGREYPWPDPTSITFGEAKQIRERLGFSVMAALQALSTGVFDENVMLALFALAKIRADGSFSAEKLMELSIGDILIQEDEDEDEDEAEGEQEAVAEGDDAPLDDHESADSKQPVRGGGRKKKETPSPA